MDSTTANYQIIENHDNYDNTYSQFYMGRTVNQLVITKWFFFGEYCSDVDLATVPVIFNHAWPYWDTIYLTSEYEPQSFAAPTYTDSCGYTMATSDYTLTKYVSWGSDTIVSDFDSSSRVYTVSQTDELLIQYHTTYSYYYF